MTPTFLTEKSMNRLVLVLLFWCISKIVPLSSVVAAAIQVPVAEVQRQYLLGSMEADARQFRFVIEVLSPTSAELTSWDEGNTKFKLDEFLMNDTNLQFKIRESGATYKGTRNEVQQPYVGTWSQRSSKIELKFSIQEQKPLDQPQEIWTGTLDAGPQKLNVQIRGYQQLDGTIRYYFDSLSQKAGGFIGEGTRKDGKLKLTFAAIGARFQGELGSDGQSMKGKFTQGVSIDLALVRSTELSVATPAKRPQVPQAPFPYTSKEVEFSSEQEKIKLAGTLTIPDESKRYPLAILISGSGPQDRDETLFEHKPFLVMADHLTRNGIAVLRFDERGVGKSSGKFAGATSEDFARDVEAAIAFARTITEIDPQRVGLIGHSEGGYVAPMIAAKDPSIAFIVMLAGPGVNGEQILYSQGRLIAAAMGADEQELKKVRINQELAIAQVKKLGAGEKLSDRIEGMVDEAFESMKQQGMVEEGQENQDKAGIEANIRAMSDPWFRFFMKHEPASDLEKIKCPVLALNGTKDLQVDYKLNFPAIEAALKKGGHQDFLMKEMEDLNHLFQKCKTGSMTEYSEIEETFDLEALSIIANWINKKVNK